MIKAVLIDDERPAIRVLEHELKAYPEIAVAGSFINPLEALDKMAQLDPQVVFLDINMPQLQGIDVASRILDLCPEVQIVFVTAYDEYAVQAFELHALDYLLKPLTKERFAKTMQRVLKKERRPTVPSRKLVLRSFGGLWVGWQDEEPIKWRTEKTKELFAFLLHHQGREVTKAEILDQLWPDEHPEKASHQLHNGIYYIRKTLEQYGISRSLICISGSYTMKLGDIESDVQVMGSLLEDIRLQPALEKLEAVQAVYTGEYLAGADWPWAYLERERLARLYRDASLKLARLYLERKEFSKGEELLLKMYRQDAYEELITELLLVLYKTTGDKVKAARHYLEYSKFLKEELGIKPQENIEKLYSSIC